MTVVWWAGAGGVLVEPEHIQWWTRRPPGTGTGESGVKGEERGGGRRKYMYRIAENFQERKLSQILQLCGYSQKLSP